MTDPVARALAQVEREAEKVAKEAFAVGDDYAEWFAERDVWKAAAERYLRALWPFVRDARLIVYYFDRGVSASGSIIEGPQLGRALGDALLNAAACFPPEREEPRGA